MNFPDRPASVLLIAASALAMSAALAAQYGLGWQPCELCLAQRIPILLAGFIAAGGLYPPLIPLGRRVVAVIASLAFLVAAGIAVYHVGVEQHYWAASCAAAAQSNLADVDFAAELARPIHVSCDQPPWSWHGVTMAALNVVYSSATGLAGLVLAIRGKV